MPPSFYAWAAAAVVLLHLGFIAFAGAGAGLLWRWPRVAWLHVPAALWGAYIEFAGRHVPSAPQNVVRWSLGVGEEHAPRCLPVVRDPPCASY